jgi:hypothetical protein
MVGACRDQQLLEDSMPPMNASPMPSADVDVTVDVIRRLVCEQMPDLADRRLRMLAHGWDNVIVRIGDDSSRDCPDGRPS